MVTKSISTSSIFYLRETALCGLDWFKDFEGFLIDNLPMALNNDLLS